MSKIDALQKEVKELREDKIRDEGFRAGVSEARKHFFWLCGVIWATISGAVSFGGDYAYNHIPMVKQIVDIVNGVK